MTLKQKLEQEKSGENIIRLYREGIFYVAYNHSALRFKHFIFPQVKILKHILKNNEWYLRMGMVQTSPLIESLSLKFTDDTWCDYIEIPCESIDTILKDIVPDKIIDRKLKNNILKIEKVQMVAEQEVLCAIRKLDISHLTPLKSLIMISEWQEILKGE